MYNIHKLKQIFRVLLEEGTEVDPRVESERYQVRIATAVEALEGLVQENVAKRASTYIVINRHYTRQLHTYRSNDQAPHKVPQSVVIL